MVKTSENNIYAFFYPIAHTETERGIICTKLKSTLIRR